MIRQIRFAGRKELERDKRCRDEKDNRHGNPHQRRRALLVFEWRKSKYSGRRNIRRVNNSFTKCEKSGKRVAGQRRGEKIQRNGPLGPSWRARPGLDYRPPEHQAGTQKRSVLQSMQPVQPQRQLEHRRYMPSDQRERSNQQANRGIGDYVAELSRERQSKKWTHHATSDRLRKPTKQRELRSTQQK